MSLDYNNAIIVCRPSFMEKPHSGSNHKSIKCKFCEEMIWVSKKERKIIKKYPKVIICCFDCAVYMNLIRKQNGLYPRELNIINEIN